MTWLYLGILVFTVIPAVLRGRDLLSPVRIYVGIYSLLLSIYSLNLSRLQTPWSQTTLMLFWGANALFLGGAFLVAMIGRIKFPDWRFDFGRIRQALREDARTVDWEWFFKLWKIAAAVFVVCFAGATMITGSVPILSDNPDKARLAFFSASLPTNYGIFFGPLAMMMAVEMLLFAGLGRGRKFLVIAVTLVLFLLYMAIITRYDIFRFFIFAIVLYNYGRRNLGFVHLGAGTAALAVIFVIGMLVRVNSDTIQSFNEIIQVKLPKHLAWASNPYAYLANDFWNLDYAIRKFADGNDHYPLQYGFGLLRGPLTLIFMEGPLTQAYGFDTIMNESIEKIKGLNTIVYVWSLYKDFGALGVFGITLAASVTLCLFYGNTMRRPTILRVSLWGLLVPAVLLSYHAALWEYWFWYFNMAWFLLAHRRLGFA